MQKFSFYLVRFEIYRQKTKYGPILGLFSKSYNRGLRLIGWTYRIAIFRVDKASEVITFEQKKICKIWPPGGAASILIISVFARFDHVRPWFEGFSLAEMNNLHKMKLTKEKKMGGNRSFGRKSHFSKQVIPSFASRALEALFVAEKSFVVNQNDKKIIEEDSSFHLTYQTLISDHWWL